MDEGKKKEEGMHAGGYVISSRNIWLMVGGVLGTLAAIGIGKASNKIRPAVVGVVKEGYAFKEWVAGKYEKIKEDMEDIIAEAAYAYHKDLETTAEAVKREKEILKKAEETIEKKASRKKTRKEGK